MKRVFTFVVLALVVAGFSKAQAQTKIGVVSADEIFAKMKEYKKADSSLNAYSKALADNYKEEEDELNSALEKFFKDSAKMQPAAKEAKRTSLQKKIADLQNNQQQFNQALEAEKEKQIAPVREMLMKAIRETAKENAYTHVLYKEQLIVFPEADDFTDKVKKKLNIKE
jgi:outer membrane protein